MEERLYLGWFTLQWHITHRCNLRCSHCYQRDFDAFCSRDAMLETLEKFRVFLDNRQLRGHLNVTGGEPLMHPDLFFLLEAAREREISAAVLTNGTLIDGRTARRLSRAGVTYVQVSLDGTKAVHDAIRGSGSFDRAVAGIETALRCGIDVTVSFTAQNGNIGDFEALARFCRKLGVGKLWFDRVVIPAAEDINGLSLSAADYQTLCGIASKRRYRDTVACIRALQFIPCKQRHIYACTAGKRQLALLADGTVLPCRRLPLPAGNVLFSDFETICRESPLLQALSDAGIPDACSGCRWAQTCRGGAKCIAYAKTGRWDVRDPDCPVPADAGR
ncbi:MAG: radical SAM protein [Clostridia bacterium]|nr:radical SAM protein [Clostridia bacterium]